MKCIWSDTLHKLVTSADSGHAGLRSGACPVTQEGPAAYCGDAEKGTGFGAGAPAAFHLGSTRPVTDGSASSQQCGCGGEVDLDLSALKNIYLDRAERTICNAGPKRSTSSTIRSSVRQTWPWETAQPAWFQRS